MSNPELRPFAEILLASLREGFAVDLKGSDDAKCECVAHAHGSSTGEVRALTKTEYRQSLTAIAARGSRQYIAWGPRQTPKTNCANTQPGCGGTRCRAFSFVWIIFFDHAQSEHSCGLDSDRNASGFQRENLRRYAVGVLRASPGALQGPDIRETAIRRAKRGAGRGRQGHSMALGHRPGHADSSHTTLFCAGSSLMPSVPADLNWRKSMGE